MYAFTLCTMHVGIYVYVLDRAISILRQILTAVEYMGECFILVFLQKKTNQKIRENDVHLVLPLPP